MKIILMEKVHNLGNVGELVNVKPGYGRNYLIPHGKAAAATQANIAKFEARRAEIEKHAAEQLKEAQQRATKLVDLLVTIKAKVGEEGRLFGSVGTADLATAISNAAGVVIAKSEVHLPAGSLRQVGEYDILLQLHADVEKTVKIQVIPEE